MSESTKAPVVCGNCRHMSTDHGEGGKCDGVGCYCEKFEAESFPGEHKAGREADPTAPEVEVEPRRRQPEPEPSRTTTRGGGN